MQGFFEVWGEGATWEELVQSVNAFPEARKLPWLGSNTTMKVHRPAWLAADQGIRCVCPSIQRRKAHTGLFPAGCKACVSDEDCRVQKPVPKCGAETCADSIAAGHANPRVPQQATVRAITVSARSGADSGCAVGPLLGPCANGAARMKLRLDVPI